MSGRARDIRYGRRGGRWVDEPRRLVPIDDTEGERVAVVLDPEVLFDPATIAAQRAHDRQCHKDHADGAPCPPDIDPDDLAAVRAGRARMARARQAAGQPLTSLDRVALALDDPEAEQ
jgi:hypothetical protein